MDGISAYVSPPYSEAAREDAIFHYTTAEGLRGILKEGEIRGTAYFCANDVSELAAGRGVLTPMFRAKTIELMRSDDSRVRIFGSRGVHILSYAENFEQHIASSALSWLCAYITCFCKANRQEDFTHGLLSQWRGYGPDGGYAIQLSRKKLLGAIDRACQATGLNYDVQDVHYKVDNPFKAKVLQNVGAFVQAYLNHLDMLARDIVSKTVPSPIAGLGGAPLQSYLDYLIHTKSEHFSEENECRLCLMQLTKVSEEAECRPVDYYTRRGLLVPYTQTPSAHFDLRSCIDWIVVGPGPRMGARYRSVRHLVGQYGPQIQVRPSEIPFTRF